MKKNISLMALTGILTLASCGQNTGPTPVNCVAPQVEQNGVCVVPVTPAPTVTTSVLTIDLVNVANAPITIRDANGALVAGYNSAVTGDGQTITLPRGTYTVTAGGVNGFVAPDARTVDLTTGNQTVTLTYTAQQTTPAPTPAARGAYYINADGVLTAIPAADITALRNGDASRFVFNAWLENKPDGVLISDTNAITGTPSLDEQNEVAPARTQNLAVAYVGYRADDGNVYPVAGATVRWNIMGDPQTANPTIDPNYAGVFDGTSASVIFGAADDGGNDTGFVGGITPLSISANAKQADTITNYVGGNNIPFPAYKNNRYTLNNATGVTGPNVNGLTWTTLFANRDYAAAEVVAVAFIDGMEIDKAVVNKYFAPRPELQIDKRVVSDSDGVDNGVGVVPVNGFVTFDIVVTNTSGRANNINLTDLLDLGNADAYNIVDAVRVFGPAGTNAPAVDLIPAAAAQDGFNYSIPTLNAGESFTFRFTVTANQPGAYCDTGVVSRYDSPYFGAYENVNLTDNACAIFTAPRFAITKSFAQNALQTNAVATPGQDVPVYITVTNTGNTAGTFDLVNEYLTRVNGVNIVRGTTDVPAYNIVASAGATPVAGTDDLTFNTDGLVTLAAGGSVTYQFTAEATADGQYCDAAEVVGTSFGGDQTSNEACLTVVSPTITKVNNPRVLRPGDAYTSTITVRNPSAYTPITVNLNDTLGTNAANGQTVNFSGASYSVNGNPAVVVAPGATAAAANNVVIPAGGSVVFTVNNVVPAGSAGTFCNVATFVPSFNAAYANNTARDCVYVQTNVALQTQLTDTVDPIVRNGGINADGRTTYVSILSNEISSNETIGNSLVKYAFGAQTGIVNLNPGDGLFNNPTATRVYFDPTPQRDPVTGAVVSDYTNGTAVLLSNQNNADYAITLNANGEQNLEIYRDLPAGAAFFIVHEGVSANSTVAATNPATGNNVYSTNYVWTAVGVASGTNYNATSAEPTSVR